MVKMGGKQSKFAALKSILHPYHKEAYGSAVE